MGDALQSAGSDRPLLRDLPAGVEASDPAYTSRQLPSGARVPVSLVSTLPITRRDVVSGSGPVAAPADLGAVATTDGRTVEVFARSLSGGIGATVTPYVRAGGASWALPAITVAAPSAEPLAAAQAVALSRLGEAVGFRAQSSGASPCDVEIVVVVRS